MTFKEESKMEITNEQIEKIKKLEQELYEETTRAYSESGYDSTTFIARVARWSTAFDIMNEILGIEPDRFNQG